MFYKKDNDLGTIEYDVNIIGNIIRNNIEMYHGRVLLSDARGRIRKNSPKSRGADDLTFFDIIETDGVYDLDVYIVLKFGTSIKSTSLELINTMRREISQVTGIMINNLRITITGMLSKNFIKRHIEVEG